MSYQHETRCELCEEDEFQCIACAIYEDDQEFLREQDDFYERDEEE